jgi:hypothetical protein
MRQARRSRYFCHRIFVPPAERELQIEKRPSSPEAVASVASERVRQWCNTGLADYHSEIKWSPGMGDSG